ncbi:hypothetical protein ACFPMF_23865 [Larkinella bovis]|uniref:Replication-associated protein G2P N-terminal domain-containing protein n=1 Tax=Larkinella bovis TaxID=683041 RepID=A0ABW0IIS7_9BACT
MFDGITIQDVSVNVDALLTNERLTFGTLVDGQTGVILNPVRKAYDRGLTFRLVPRKTGKGYRVEVKGSLHKFFNGGLHNADQYTANDLLLTLDQLATEYGFNLFDSVINNIEFGVNVELPFPVAKVLANLICYKNQPFAVDSHSSIPYYVCDRQRYVVKMYDKGKQKGLAANVLRFEIRVRKMRYFDGKGVRLHTLVDLLNVANYGPLGVLLVNTFNNILFDDPAIDTKNLNTDQRHIYQQGRNPRYWHTPENLTVKQAATHRQRLSRNKNRFRALLDQYGSNWQLEVAAFVRQTWDQLTTVDDQLLTRIDQHKSTWQNLSKPYTLNGFAVSEYSEETVINEGATCHKLTDFTPPVCHELTAPPTPSLSQINPLYSGVPCDSNQPDQSCSDLSDLQQKQGVAVCPVTGITIESPRPRQRFISITQIKNLARTNRQMFNALADRFLTGKQAGAVFEKRCYYIAHNIRNTYANQFNNPLRRLKKYQRSIEGQLPLLSTSQVIKPTERIQAGIDYRKGTGYEIIF